MGHYKYLIVGQGLAGTVLSHCFLEKNISHKVMDNGHQSAATLAAAGIINPITGRRYVKSWMIDELLPVADEIYSNLEKVLEIELVAKTVIVRTFANNAQENLWNESTSRPGYADYIGEASLAEGFDKLIEKPFGWGVIKQARKVNVGKLISTYQKYLSANDLLIKDSFDHTRIEAEATNHGIGEDEFDKIIFCEGYKAIENPWFKYLPFQPAKGESLKVKVDGTLPDYMIRDNIFIAPGPDHYFWTGGGYQWEELSEVPTAAFRAQWEDKLSKLLNVPYEVVQHKAGVRPSVKGRRPLIGRHPVHSTLHILNGMGTKGTSLAPFWARKFVEFLEEGAELSSEVDINRFSE